MRLCLFCDHAANSREDAWPLWLLGRFPVPRGAKASLQRGGTAPKTWTHAGHGHKVRFVCADCNNGWMSDLETQAKPILEPLLAGKKTEVTRLEQHVLSRWSIKMAMVWEAVRADGQPFYTREECAALRSGQGLPTRTGVWMATCLELPGIYCEASHLTESPMRLPSEASMYVSTFAFGNFAIQVATGRAPAHIQADVKMSVSEHSGAWAETALRIWPAGETTAWPLRLGLGGEPGLALFSRSCDHTNMQAPPYRGPAGARQLLLLPLPVGSQRQLACARRPR
jgi:hypothetical protein